MRTTEIRAAKVEDLDAILKLCLQLGYNPTRENVAAAILSMSSNPDYEVVVITEENTVVGWMTLCIRHRIEDVPFMQIAAIVTDEGRRGLGLGKELTQYAENRAREKELSLVALHSSKPRESAHKFYEHQGYSRLKESYFYCKNI